MAKVLIIGASRGIGLETVKAALQAGHSVGALARSARRIPVDHPKLEKMAGAFRPGPKSSSSRRGFSPKRRGCSSPRWSRLTSSG